jgi:hypothetical protein
MTYVERMIVRKGHPRRPRLFNLPAYGKRVNGINVMIAYIRSLAK